MSVVLNKGDGTFQSAVSYDAGVYPNSVFSIDLDGDGDNDLATSGESNPDGSISILLNYDDGSFQRAVNYAVGVNPNSVFSSDLDGDGDNDLATANSSSDNVSVLLNNRSEERRVGKEGSSRWSTYH